MSIREITIDELRHMNGQEALILQGCGAPLQEWQDGINDILTQEGILLEGTRFTDILSFQNGNLTCLVFPFSDDVKLSLGKLALWRISTHENLGSTWLSDYVPNRLGGFAHEDPVEEEMPEPVQPEPAQREKPDCELIGKDGNVFNLMGIAARTLRQNDMAAEAQEMLDRIKSQAGNYYEALGIIGEYVNITGPEDAPDEFEEQELEP